MKNKIRYFKWLGEYHPLYIKLWIFKEGGATGVFFNGMRTEGTGGELDPTRWEEISEAEAALII
jgi:hypothetical protein